MSARWTPPTTGDDEVAERTVLSVLVALTFGLTGAVATGTWDAFVTATLHAVAVAMFTTLGTPILGVLWVTEMLLPTPLPLG